MASFSQENINIGNTILSVGQSMGANNKQIRAAFAAAWVESRIRNLNYGDRDSVGVFQQRPSQGWGTVEQILNVPYAARKFFETAMRVSQAGTVGQLAQRVQRSAYPERYDQALSISDELLNRLSGNLIEPTVLSTSQLNAIASQQPQTSGLDKNAFIIIAVGLGALLVFGNRYY